MKKEKKVRTYQRRTKSGKTVTVRAHTASYEAAEKAKEAAKKKGAGDEIAERKKKNWELPMNEFLKKLKEERAQKREEEESKRVEDEKTKKSEKKTEKKTPAKKTTKKRTVGTGTNGPEPKKKTTTKKTATKAATSEPAFTSAEFKEWYRGTGSDADKKVAKALRKQLGRSGYRKFEDEAISNYTSRGHLSMFKRVSGGSFASTKDKSASVSTKAASKVTSTNIKKGLVKPIVDVPYTTKGKNYYKGLKEGDKVTFHREGKLVNATVGKDSSGLMFVESSGRNKGRIVYPDVDKDNRIRIYGKNQGVTVEKAKTPMVTSQKSMDSKSSAKGSLGITKSEFKSWYNDTDGSSASFKKVNRALKKFYGKDWDEVENRATFGGKTQYQDMLREIGSRFSTSPKESKKRSVGTGTNGPEPKQSEEVKKELARQKEYVKYLSKWSRVPAMKSYLNAQSKILSDLKSYSGPIKTDREIDNSTKALAKKHGLSYEGGEEFRDKKGGRYRISTNPITGISTLHPLTEHSKPIVKRRK